MSNIDPSLEGTTVFDSAGSDGGAVGKAFSKSLSAHLRHVDYGSPASPVQSMGYSQHQRPGQDTNHLLIDGGGDLGPARAHKHSGVDYSREGVVDDRFQILSNDALPYGAEFDDSFSEYGQYALLGQSEVYDGLTCHEDRQHPNQSLRWGRPFPDNRLNQATESNDRTLAYNEDQGGTFKERNAVAAYIAQAALSLGEAYTNTGAPDQEEDLGDDTTADPQAATPVTPYMNKTLAFHSYDAAKQVLQALAWDPPKNDPTIPTDAEYYSIVKRLIWAMEDKTVAQGWAKSQNRDNPVAGYTTNFVEAKAWEILHEALVLHTGACYDNTIHSEPDEKLSFAERITKIVKLLREYKQTVHCIMKSQGVANYVAFPAEHYRRKAQNAKGNAAKQKILDLGRAFQSPQGS